MTLTGSNVLAVSVVCALSALVQAASAKAVPAKTLALITAVASDCAHFDATEIDTYSFTDASANGTAGGTYTLYQVQCSLAAYNTSQRYFLQDQYGTVSQIALATPIVKTTYADPQEMAQVKSISVSSYSSETEISNSSFDPQTQTLTASHKWRGVGDASESGTWVFQEGRFVLQRYEMDPTFDGEINVVTVWYKGKAID
ncbi:MAG: DUF1176 domain-containing protein [Pseudomonadota bacterium]